MGVVTSPSVTITSLRYTNLVEVELEVNFKLKATVVLINRECVLKIMGSHEDCFTHLDLSLKFYALIGQVNGVLGQTTASNYVIQKLSKTYITSKENQNKVS